MTATARTSAITPRATVFTFDPLERVDRLPLNGQNGDIPGSKLAARVKACRQGRGSRCINGRNVMSLALRGKWGDVVQQTARGEKGGDGMEFRSKPSQWPPPEWI